MFLVHLITFKMRVLIIVATACLALVNASPFPSVGTKCNIDSEVFWRSPNNTNPNEYIFCNTDKLVEVGKCPSGLGFKKTGDRNCTSYSSWTCLNFEMVLTCENNQPEYLRPLPNPNMYSFCSGNTVKAANCPPNTGFADGEKVSGCVPWSVWNDVTGCLEA